MELSLLGAAVVGLVLVDDKLAAIEFEDGRISDLTLDKPPVFSAAALEKWSERYPWGYGVDEVDSGGDEVYRSVSGIGLTRLPRRSVIVADPRLQRFPPNLYLIDGNFAGMIERSALLPRWNG